ncbi:N-acetylneuraminate synthase family protein [Roseibium salinum]|nr:N-acetylneuraminate synthase family protein [Roseibium salinum]
MNAAFLPSVCAAAMGAVSIERHVTLDRNDWGSDQKASLEMNEMAELVSQLRRLEVVRGDGQLRVYDDEKPIAEKLRRKRYAPGSLIAPALHLSPEHPAR